MEPHCFQITADNEPRPKYQRSSCATSKKHGSTWEPWNCFKEQLHGFLLTFEWCHGSQMMLISLNRNTAPVHSRVVQWVKYAAAPASWPRSPFWVSLGLTYAIWGMVAMTPLGHHLTSSPLSPHRSDLLHASSQTQTLPRTYLHGQ